MCIRDSRDFMLAPTPFSFDVREEFNYHADSVFRVDVSEPGGLHFSKEGFYHFQVDTTSKSGITLFQFENGFPNITSPHQMLESMRYLTYKPEFEEIAAKPNIKSAVDAFWLGRGCLLYTSPSPRDRTRSRMPSSACKKNNITIIIR